jgi:hypothetical protein
MPWAILICKFKDALSEPPIPMTTFEKLFTRRGEGTDNLIRYFHDISHGSIDISGSEIFPRHRWLIIDVNHHEYTPPAEPPPPDWTQTIDRTTLIRRVRDAAYEARLPIGNKT